MRRLPLILLSFVLLVSTAACDLWDGSHAEEVGSQDEPAVVGTGDGAPAALSAGAGEPQRGTNGSASVQATPAPDPTLTLVGRNPLGSAGFHGDVFSFNGFAYVGTWGATGACPATGVKIIDIGDPANPEWAATVAAIPGTSQEDMSVRRLRTPAFSGDLLVVGIQSCGGSARGGVALVDVSDPRNPVDLGFYGTGSGRGVHELDLVLQGDRALALLAVPSAEPISAGRQVDFQILDVSDPRRPVEIGSWGARRDGGLSLEQRAGCESIVYDHSARASADGQRAYLSYMDLGVIILDISDPSAPRMLGRVPVPPEEEGTTHSVAELGDGRHLLVADEDDVYEAPHGVRVHVETPGGLLDLKGCESDYSVRLDRTGLLEGSLVPVGDLCNGAGANDLRDQIVLISAGPCSVYTQALAAQRAGARAALVTVPGEASSPRGGSNLNIPVVALGATDSFNLRATAQAGEVRVRLPGARHWTGLRVWDISDPAAPRLVSTYHTPNSLAFPTPGDGFYTIHNPEVRDGFAYLSWYTDGLRVVDLRDPAAPREVTAYVPEAVANPQRSYFPNETMVWGVALVDDLVLISDVNSGLHILRIG